MQMNALLARLKGLAAVSQATPAFTPEHQHGRDEHRYTPKADEPTSISQLVLDPTTYSRLLKTSGISGMGNHAQPDSESRDVVHLAVPPNTPIHPTPRSTQVSSRRGSVPSIAEE
ncbi:hypothetical protein CYLTODRAFT_424026 [Cylindrobasidium torrendii FP15055 ss-10]|uniref:Uncharacterized protein n=1 Tax=Cylindrobasidium torrendii FP15055 ss-10 TaxID=1314674 RepID=A0A0D7B6F7_9AGAR|nr:hypothetical protein CYLTODRAFT_424026 [Cylindrobasidium torrendii FP15055 ss-10]